jgi:sarcosine oxidase
MDAFTPDRHALVGHLPGTPHAVLLAGFSGHGFKLAPVIGEIAADLLLDGTTMHAIEHLGSPTEAGIMSIHPETTSAAGP